MRLNSAIPVEPFRSFITVPDVGKRYCPFVKTSENLFGTVRVPVDRHKYTLSVVVAARVTLVKNDVLKVILESGPSSEALVRSCHQLREKGNERRVPVEERIRFF